MTRREGKDPASQLKYCFIVTSKHRPNVVFGTEDDHSLFGRV